MISEEAFDFLQAENKILTIQESTADLVTLAFHRKLLKTKQ